MNRNRSNEEEFEDLKACCWVAVDAAGREGVTSGKLGFDLSCNKKAIGASLYACMKEGKVTRSEDGMRPRWVSLKQPPESASNVCAPDRFCYKGDKARNCGSRQEMSSRGSTSSRDSPRRDGQGRWSEIAMGRPREDSTHSGSERGKDDKFKKGPGSSSDEGEKKNGKKTLGSSSRQVAMREDRGDLIPGEDLIPTEKNKILGSSSRQVAMRGDRGDLILGEDLIPTEKSKIPGSPSRRVAARGNQGDPILKELIELERRIKEARGRDQDPFRDDLDEKGEKEGSRNEKLLDHRGRDQDPFRDDLDEKGEKEGLRNEKLLDHKKNQTPDGQSGKKLAYFKFSKGE